MRIRIRRPRQAVDIPVVNVEVAQASAAARICAVYAAACREALPAGNSGLTKEYVDRVFVQTNSGFPRVNASDWLQIIRTQGDKHQVFTAWSPGNKMPSGIAEASTEADGARFMDYVHVLKPSIPEGQAAVKGLFSAVKEFHAGQPFSTSVPAHDKGRIQAYAGLGLYPKPIRLELMVGKYAVPMIEMHYPGEVA